MRSFFEHLRAAGLVPLNPASTRLVYPPALPEETAGRALTPREALILLAGPDRRKAEGARDDALMLAMLRLGLRVSEACGLRSSVVRWSHGRWTLRVKGGRERTLPLPQEVKRAIDDYLRLDESIIGLYKTEVIHRRGPWRRLDDVEYATFTWVDWFNNRRLPASIGNLPPAEFELMYRQHGESATAA